MNSIDKVKVITIVEDDNSTIINVNDKVTSKQDALRIFLRAVQQIEEEIYDELSENRSIK